jgi:Uma2 family endonuclease
MTLERVRVTRHEFEALVQQPENQDRLLELVDGEIVEKVTTEEHGEVQVFLGGLVSTFVRTHKLGRVGTEVSHEMPHDDFNERKPDISFIAGNRPRVTKGSVMRMPDLAIEIKSPGNTLKELREKAIYYFANGTRLVWIVHPAKKLVIVLTPDDENILVEGDILDGGEVLPGFSVPVADIFADPLDSQV